MLRQDQVHIQKCEIHDSNVHKSDENSASNQEEGSKYW